MAVCAFDAGHEKLKLLKLSDSLEDFRAMWKPARLPFPTAVSPAVSISFVDETGHLIDVSNKWASLPIYSASIRGGTYKFMKGKASVPQIDGRVQKLRDGRRLLQQPGISGHAKILGVNRRNQIVVEVIAANPATGQVPNTSTCINRGGVLFGPLPVSLGAEMRIQRLPETLFTQSPALSDGGEFFKRGLRVRCLVKAVCKSPRAVADPLPLQPSWCSARPLRREFFPADTDCDSRNDTAR